MRRFESWGRYPRQEPARVVPVRWRSEPPDLAVLPAPLLPFGQGRSYGDACLNEGGTLVDTDGLSRLVSFDPEGRLVRCEAGMTLAALLYVLVPRGFFLPVSPGTKFVSVGGAIANDIHGKNHHVAGTFGRHVTAFELLRSDGSRTLCRPDGDARGAELFRATVGGLGLTGLILWAEFRVLPIASAHLDVEKLRIGSLREFFDVNAASDRDWAYTVAWVDSLAKGKSLGRGIYMRGNHLLAPVDADRAVRTPRSIPVPCDAPAFLLNALTMRAFNEVYFRSLLGARSRGNVHYEPFFYPLDAVLDWNRLYGSRGFLQYQCVVPTDVGEAATRELLERVARAGAGSFLNVLKKFGDVPSPGLLSFPRPGLTLALDFAFQGEKTLRLLEELDGVVRAAKGAVYPAKDARMSPESFRAFFPEWEELARFVDPRFSSSFWRRVTSDARRAA